MTLSHPWGAVHSGFGSDFMRRPGCLDWWYPSNTRLLGILKPMVGFLFDDQGIRIWWCRRRYVGVMTWLAFFLFLVRQLFIDFSTLKWGCVYFGRMSYYPGYRTVYVSESVAAALLLMTMTIFIIRNYFAFIEF